LLMCFYLKNECEDYERRGIHNYVSRDTRADIGEMQIIEP